MTFTDETLMAFADGTLPEAEALRLAEALETDPALAERVALLAEGRDAARGAFAQVLDEPVPARLLAAAQGPVAGNDNAPRRWRGMGVAVAASLALGVFLGTLAPGGDAPGMLAAPVRAALDGSATGALGAVRVTGTHVVEGGMVCRSFAAQEAQGAMLGLACREPDGWRLRVAVARGGASEAFQPASGGDPVIGEVLERLGAGPVLGTAEEAAAQRRGWLPAR
jgi:hypothetical protein